MGVAVYGEPSLLGQVGDVLNLRRGVAPSLNLDYFSHHRDGVEMTWEAGTPVLGELWSGRMEEVFGARRPPAAEGSSRDRGLDPMVPARPHKPPPPHSPLSYAHSPHPPARPS